MFATTKRFWSTMQSSDHKQICIIYETVYFCIGEGGLVQFIVPSWLEKNEF